MSNPSTVWTQLSSPNSAVGSLPFVYTDGTTIMTDVANFSYSQLNDTGIGTGSQLAYQLKVLNGLRVSYQDTTATPGAATINKIAGRFKIAAGATSVVITNNCCFATSIVHAEIEGAFDTTAKKVQITPAAGSFTATLDAACTAAVVVNFTITNVF